MIISPVSMASFGSAKTAPLALMNSLKLSALKLNIPTEKINSAKNVDDLKKIICEAQLEKRAKDLNIKRKPDEAMAAFKERIDFDAYKLKAINKGIKTEDINKCSSSKELHEMMKSDDTKAYLEKLAKEKEKAAAAAKEAEAAKKAAEKEAALESFYAQDYSDSWVSLASLY